MTTKPHLITLNRLLSGLNLPAHRKVVDDSGSNLSWLRKHVWDRNDEVPEVQTLLSMSDCDLMSA